MEVHSISISSLTNSNLANSDCSQRLVEYVADGNGFRARVQTNEIGTKPESSADVELLASPQAHHEQQTPGITGTRQVAGSQSRSAGAIYVQQAQLDSRIEGNSMNRRRNQSGPKGYNNNRRLSSRANSRKVESTKSNPKTCFENRTDSRAYAADNKKRPKGKPHIEDFSADPGYQYTPRVG